ncbi:hypothetical protein P152DRAFT_506710 [Eremomyces bilateralis CBS 781.70]|uniref:50S ribosomal protein YmL27 n=1 Tax=Eremomyces bilateralis CBS 781.70 TaxID=1392243 RepID=A0A6G1G7N5_9PEZI|nr:uncharacterized protein P152DRAFT_506710 [Eremomyces bilateralis CBS 781.70]KAF1813946.1 hypothetical protein P152DRAFT_506710 [Eremomyces bilateralis CBS 781.70]
MFTPTMPLSRALRRLALTTKRARKGFYKGTGTGSMGHFNQHADGRPRFPFAIYRVDYSKVRTYVRPMYLDDCMLTPFVARGHGIASTSNPDKPRTLRNPYYYDEKYPYMKDRWSGRFYLHRWKKELGEE